MSNPYSAQQAQNLLGDSLAAILALRERLPEIVSLAQRLTPVEDLVRFKHQIEQVHGHLDLLVEASEIIIQISDMGFDIITARQPSVVRDLLELGTAALKDVEYFATAEDFNVLKDRMEVVEAGIAALSGAITAIRAELVALHDKDADLQDQIDNLRLALNTIAEHPGLSQLTTDTATLKELVTSLQVQLTSANGELHAQATALQVLRTSVTEQDGVITALSQFTTTLSARITGVNNSLDAYALSVDDLTSRVVVAEGFIQVEAAKTTNLAARLTTAEGSISANSFANTQLSARVTQVGNLYESVATEQTQLRAEYTDTTQNLSAVSVAQQDLIARTVVTEDSINVLAQDTTFLRAELSGGNNQLRNTDFSSGLAGWTITDRGQGWDSAVLTRNLHPTTHLPEGLNTLGVTVEQAVGGTVAIMSTAIAVTPSTPYMVSGYIAGIGMTVSLEARLYDESGIEIFMDGLVGQATAGDGGKLLRHWPHHYRLFQTPANAATMRLRVLGYSPTGSSHSVLLMRPMVEQAKEGQTKPSAYVPGSIDVDSAFAEANQDLYARLEATEQGVTAAAGDIVTLRADVNNKASTSALNALTTTVSDLNGAVTANVNQTTELIAKLDVGGIIPLTNPSFELDTGWSGSATGNTGVLPTNASYLNANLSNTHTGTRILRIGGSATSTTVYSGDLFQVRAGEELRAGVYVRTFGTNPNSGSRVNVGVHFRSADGQLVSGGNINASKVHTGAYGWTLVEVVGTAPDTAVTAKMYLQTTHTEGFYAFDDAYVERISAGQRALATAISETNVNVANVGNTATATADTLAGITTRMPTGTGTLATEARVVSAENAAATANSATTNRVGVVEARMPAGSGVLATKASTDAAAAAAQTASDLAGGKGKVIFGSSAPATADRVAQNLWIDTTGSANTPKRWSGSAWVAVTDKAATDAAAAAAQAIQAAATVDARVTTVENASVSRDNANASAIQNVQSAMGNAVLGYNLSFEEGNGTGKLNWYTNTSLTSEGMMVDSGFYSSSVAHGALAVRLNPTTTTSRAWYNGMQFPVVAGERIYVQMDSRTAGSTPAIGTDLRIGLRVWLGDGTAANYYAPRYIATVSETWLWGQKILSGWLTMPANAVKACLLIYNAGQTEGSIVIDDIRIERESVSDAANASGISGLTTRVSSNEGQIAAQAASINNVTATANSASASITNLMEVTAQGNAVAVWDGGFEVDASWGSGSTTLETATTAMPLNSQYRSDVQRSGARSFAMLSGFNSSLFNNRWLRVSQGQKLRVTFWTRITGAAATSGYVRAAVRTWDGAKVHLPYGTVPGASVNLVSISTTWQKVTGIYEVPAGTSYAQFAIQCNNSAQTNTNIYVDDFSVEFIGEEMELARAKHTVALDVNGNVSGTVNENDGTRSSFSILATVFRVLSSVTGMGMEWQDGYLRMWKGSAQIVMGHTFGPGDLLFWAGPNVGAASVTKANGTWWLDTAGNSYFAGQVLQGILRSFNSTTSTSTTASVSVVAARLGKTVAVTARYQYQYSQVYNDWTSNITLGAGSNVAVVAIDRRYGTGAWSEITRANIGGQSDVVNLTDAPSNITQTISGQVFTTDTASTSNTEYRARLISISRQPHTVTNPGTTPAAVINQYLSIEGIE